MKRAARGITTLLCGSILSVLVVACSGDSATTPIMPVGVRASSQVWPPGTCVTGPTCYGASATPAVEIEMVKVCKYWPSGTVNPPTTTIHLSVITQNTPGSPTEIDFPVSPNTCIYVWGNGEQFGPGTDQVTITETVPAGSTFISSQVTTVTRNTAAVVNAATNNLSVSGVVGGPGGPGLVVVFNNMLTPPPPPPADGCTLTQGYWKNHESEWPAPFSPTAQWLDASHKVTGVTWDGLLEMSVTGGNSYMQLAHQWIAASLNKATGATVPQSVLDAMASAEAWLKANTPAVTSSVPKIKNNQATAWAGILDAYNNGLSGTPHCGTVVLN